LTLKSKNRKSSLTQTLAIGQTSLKTNNTLPAPGTLNCFLLNNNTTVSALPWHNKLLQICCLIDPKEAGSHFQSLTASSAKCVRAHKHRERRKHALDTLTSRKAQSSEGKKYNPISSQRTCSTGRAERPNRHSQN